MTDVDDLISRVSDVDDFLEHHGIKGMKWGRRQSRPAGVSRKTDKEAKKDAEEFARAKMFYGQGAGTRRKLIKSQVESKSKTSASYKSAFDHHLANQNMAEHTTKAISERRRKNTINTTTKTARGVHRQLTGGFGGVTLASAAIAAGYVAARKTGTDKIIMDAAKKKMSDVVNDVKDKKKKNNVVDLDTWLQKNLYND